MWVPSPIHFPSGSGGLFLSEHGRRNKLAGLGSSEALAIDFVSDALLWIEPCLLLPFPSIASDLSLMDLIKSADVWNDSRRESQRSLHSSLSSLLAASLVWSIRLRTWVRMAPTRGAAKSHFSSFSNPRTHRAVCSIEWIRLSINPILASRSFSLFKLDRFISISARVSSEPGARKLCAFVRLSEFSSGSSCRSFSLN